MLTPSGHDCFANSAATSQPNASSPKKIFPIPATRRRVGTMAVDQVEPTCILQPTRDLKKVAAPLCKETLRVFLRLEVSSACHARTRGGRHRRVARVSWSMPHRAVEGTGEILLGKCHFRAPRTKVRLPFPARASSPAADRENCNR